MTRQAYVRRRSGFGDVVVKRDGYVSGLDDFPTPPWATRAFFEYVVPQLSLRPKLTFLEPACGRGYMTRVLRDEMRFKTESCDVYDYGSGYRVADYCDRSVKFRPYDVMITNPPFKRATEFVERALDEANFGVAILIRTLWLEGGRGGVRSRYARLFQNRPPNRIATISGRMPAIGGAIVRNRPVFVSHSWFWWNLSKSRTEFCWIPPDAQKKLESDADYDKDWLRGGRRVS